MLRRRLILSVMPLLVCGLISAFALPRLQRQASTIALSETHHSVDGSFTFSYPQGWFADKLDDGRVVLENEPPEKLNESGNAVRLEISPPIPVSELNMLGQGNMPSDLVKYAIGSSTAIMSLMSGMASGTISPSSGTPASTASVGFDVPVVNFTVNGRPAAWGKSADTSSGYEIASMTVYIDIGNNHVVRIYASPWLDGGATLLNRYENTVLAIADTVRYSPVIAATSSSGDLPKTFTGVVGGWQMGEITFNYPADWYVLSFGPLLQTTDAPLNQRDLKSGQMQAGIVDPASNMALIKDWRDVTNCRANPEGVTALAVVQKQLPSTDKQREQYAAAGVTFSEPESTSVNGKDVVLLRMHQPKQDVLLIDIDLGNGNIAGLLAFASEGEMAQYEARLLAIVGTFSYKPKPDCNPPTARPAEVLTATANSITPSPSPTVFYATAVPNEKIAFLTATDKVGWQIFAMNTNGQNIQQLTNLKGIYSNVTWSPNGSHIAFIIFPNDAFLSLSAYVMRADGSDVQLLSKSVEGGLTWSPNGNQLVFTSKQDGNRQLYTIRADGTGLTQLTRGSGEVYGADWSPDGSKLVFYRDNYRLYAIKADGTSEQMMPDSQSDESPAWSPDGTMIAFASGRDRNANLNELYIMNADGTQSRALTKMLTIPPPVGREVEPDRTYAINGIIWSPDGQHIAFVTKTNGVIDAFVIDPDGSNLHHIASEVGGLSWSPDSRHMVYSAGELGKTQVFVADADGANKYSIVSDDPMISSLVWSPSGRR